MEKRVTRVWFCLQRLGRKSRAPSSEILLNLESYLPRFHRPLLGKWAQGRSVWKLIISLCVPPGGEEILEEALQGRMGRGL